MGGSAFSSQGVLTPRMSPQTYNRLKSKYHNILVTLYGHVTTPPEAPGKSSYGDLDYLVAEPNPKTKVNGKEEVKKGNGGISHLTTMADVKVAFGAEYMSTISGATTSFAVLIEPDRDDTEGGEEVEKEKVYAQIDVHVCPSAENMQWVSFKHSYGDLWSILGMMGRAKGLVADEKCLNVRVQEIEDQNRELAKVELTRSVSETLEFFGLDVERYKGGFGTVEEVYEFAVGSRFFEGRYFREKKFANAHDRSKVGKREMMKGFFAFLGVDIALIGKVEGGEKGEELTKVEEEKEEEGVITREDEGTKTPEEKLTREQVLEEALEKFGRKKAYNEKVKAWRRSVRIDTVVRGVAKGLIEGGHNSPNSARVKASRLRKQINAGEMDEIFTMNEQELEKFVQDRLLEIVQRSKSGQVADAS